MPADHQSSNISGLYEAEEQTPGVLPASPQWQEREPNSYGDFGGNFGMTTRKPITRDRQYRKGEVSDNNPTSSYTEDLTGLNMRSKMQGFLYADAREVPSTRPINGARVAITSVDGTAEQYKAAAGLTVFRVGHLVLGSGFGLAANNVFTRVNAVTATAITVDANLANDAAPAATAAIEVVGFQFAAGGAVLSLPQGRALLTVAAGGIIALGLTLGEWVGVGGDTAITRFADTGAGAPFYGRISAITDTTIEFDKTTGVQAANAGAAKTIQLFFGVVVRNEDDPTLIKYRTYTQERQIGVGAGGTSSEFVRGAQCNQITITVPTPGPDAKVTIEQTHIALLSGERLAAEPNLTATGVVTAAANDPCFKPGLDVYRHKLTIIDELTLNPTGLVAYNSECSLVINNNAAGNKAIEVFGNSGVNIGEFGVTGSLNGYWTSVAATRAARQGAEATWDLILTKNNRAVIFDIASLGLGNARAQVEANTPVKIPLDTMAGKGKFGYSVLTCFLRYVPNVLLAQAQNA